jgi:cbb3-type cytochrome oxidase subunit 1
MEWFVRAFAKASVAWLAAGVTLGVGMAARPAWTVYRPAHVHMVALGFVAMMIYGVAYHVVPRRGAARRGAYRESAAPRATAGRLLRPVAAACARRGPGPTPD